MPTLSTLFRRKPRSSIHRQKIFSITVFARENRLVAWSPIVPVSESTFAQGTRIREQRRDTRRATRSEPYDWLKWTDYTEDYFYDAIWRWTYRPANDQTPRQITGFCPECNSRIVQTDWVWTQPDGDRVATVVCSRCIPDRAFRIPHFNTDHYDGIRELIAEKLRNGQWKDVVKRQLDA